ncbi:inorganic phosphate transporter [Solitalea lacus]|uniref:inorganic phosphate transporter n=1 Tax=Solitalea lacus TaxID=2911172 RepID=UPI001ED9E9A9|nr:inorganic phosphate transporter [Solitalea lacus]UKJ07824.1 inorganic phosphate transporter [Solitalea lacus]
MESAHLILIVGVLLVMVYDFTNGFHDASDMIATAIASMSMTPKVAIVLVTTFTFIGPFAGGVAVADTIGEFVRIKGESQIIAQSITIAGLLSAISFNLITWKLSLPSSSSTSLVSGLVGAGLFALNSNHIRWGFAELLNGEITGFMKILVGLFFSPLAGFFVGFLLIKLMIRLMRRLTIQSKKFFIASQYLTVSWLAFSHGTNDAQKGMGVLSMLLLASGVYPSFQVPAWVILLCASSITAGTLFGGWNIIKTVGFGIYKVKLVHSIADQVGSAFVILLSSFIGAPVSTTQVVTTTLMGVGAGERPKHVRWNTAKLIGVGWLFNIPSCILLGAVFCFIFIKIFS